MWRMVAAVNMKELVKSFDLYPETYNLIIYKTARLCCYKFTVIQCYRDRLLQANAQQLSPAYHVDFHVQMAARQQKSANRKIRTSSNNNYGDNSKRTASKGALDNPRRSTLSKDGSD
jgi:hypothetical protein